MKKIKLIKILTPVFLTAFLSGSSLFAYMPIQGKEHKLYTEADISLYIPFQDYGTGFAFNVKADYLVPLNKPFQFLAGLESGGYFLGSVDGRINDPLIGGVQNYNLDLSKMPVYINVTYPLYFLNKFTNLGGQIYTFAGFGLGMQLSSTTFTMQKTETNEGDTAFAWHIFLGANRPLGPGYLKLLFDFDFSSVKTVTGGDSGLSGFAIQVGYGFGFL